MSLVEALYTIKYCSKPPFLTFINFFTFLHHSSFPLSFLPFSSHLPLLLHSLLLALLPLPFSSPSPPSPSSPLCFLPISSLPLFLFLPSIYFCPSTVFSHILSYL